MGTPRALAFEQSRTKWPEIALDYAVWCAHLDTHGWSDELPATAGSLFLCCACARQDPAACRWLEQEQLAALRGVVLKENPNEEFVEWVLQCARQHLLGGSPPRIAAYDGRRPLSDWLRLLLRRLALEQKRVERASVNTPQTPAPELRRIR